MYMMSIMMLIFVQGITFCITARQIGMDIASIKAVDRFAKSEYLSQCTESKNHVKVVTRHVWEDYMETCEDIRHTEGMKELYSHRKKRLKESLERQRKTTDFDIRSCMAKRG